MNKLLMGLIGMAMAGAAFGKLPPPSEGAQAKAAAAKHKSAWSAKVAAFHLCQSQNKIVEKFGKNKSAAPAACTDPGPYVPPAPDQAQAPAKAPDAVAAAAKPAAPAEEKK